ELVSGGGPPAGWWRGKASKPDPSVSRLRRLPPPRDKLGEDPMHPRSMLQRPHDQADFEQLDVVQDPPRRRPPEPARPIPEAQPAHRPRQQQPRRAAREVLDPRDHPQPARILGHTLDHADPLPPPMLPQQRQRPESVLTPLAKRPREGS